MKSKSCKSNVIILGMHRSGTSLLAGTVAKSGWWVSDADNQMMSQEDNPMGFWERQDIVDLNDEILFQNEQSWHSVFADSVQPEVGSPNIFGERIASIVRELKQNSPFSIKDPRICLTWPYWAEHVSTAKIVVIVRHPMEVALSLRTRNDLPILLGLGLWLRYIKSIAIIADNQDFFHVEHRAFIENTKEITQEMFRYLIPGISDTDLCKELERASIVNQDLIHHRGDNKSLGVNYPEIAKIWEKVRKGDYVNLPETLVFLADPTYQELYKQWAQAETLLLRVQKLENVYREETQAYQKRQEVRELQQQGIAQSLIAYQSSTIYRGSRWMARALTMFTKGSQPDAIDKIAEILIKQDHIECREMHKAPVRPVGKMLALAFRNPVQFAKQLNLSRVKTVLRMLVDREARANLSIALTRYQSVVGGRKLSLLEPGSVSTDDIQLAYEALPKVSIIIPVFNELESTLACIKSITATNPSLSYEIIIADDCSTDGTMLISEQIKNLFVIKPERNQGFLGNCNNAAQRARGDYLVFLNNDTNVQSGWLEELITPMKNDPGIGLIGSKLVYPDGRLQEAGGIVFGDASGWNFGRLGDRHAPEYNYVREVDYVSGASIAIKRSLWERLGGFDEVFRPAYYEDTDICFQIRQLGLKVLYTPFSVTVHYEGISHGTDENVGIKKYQVLNKEKFFNKWKLQLEEQHLKDPSALFLAKVHGKNRPVVLIIDHYVPMHDKDAGSRSTRKYIELLVQEGIRVIFLGDNFYPHQPYTEQLQRLGVEVLYGDYYKNNWEKWLSENVAYINSIYIHRPHIAEKYLFKIKEISPDIRIVYFGHDLHFLRAQREAEVSNDAQLEGQVDQWKEIEFKIMRAADLSLFPAEYEADKVRDIDSSIHVHHIPLYWFDVADIEVPALSVAGQNLLFVGGFGHPPNRDGLQWFLNSIWPNILERNPESKLTIIGSKCPQSIYKLQNSHIQVLGEVSDAVLEDAYRKARVAIVPLRYGAGIKGKVLEAMSKGVPVCTTPVGAEGLPELDKAYLLITESESQFSENVLGLLQDEHKVNKLRLGASDILKRHFSRSKATSLVDYLFDQ